MERRAATEVMTDVVGCDGTAYVVTLDGELLALDLDSNVVRWRFTSGVSNPPLYSESHSGHRRDRVIFGGFDGTSARSARAPAACCGNGLRGVDLDIGRRDW